MEGWPAAYPERFPQVENPWLRGTTGYLGSGQYAPCHDGKWASWGLDGIANPSPQSIQQDTFPASLWKCHIGHRLWALYSPSSPSPPNSTVSQLPCTAPEYNNPASHLEGKLILITWQIAKRLLSNCDGFIFNVLSFGNLNLYQSSRTPLGSIL